jgi:curli production assembly/transport component CsgG
MRGVLAIAASLAVAGCAELADDGRFPLNPTLVEMTEQNRALRSLPAPRHRIPVAVYDFPDLTGQYNERENVQSLSRAVTQGGSTMLIQALQDAGERRWFAVLDRSGLQDLVRERQIVTEMRRQYRGETEIDPSALGPLLHAGILLQGGIVGYDTNVQTGGLGARYLGIGADTQWRLDTITVALRAVSTETGEVLASVMAQKTILSESLRGNVFRYVALDELLEIEGGVTANEPRQIATQQAIEKAVMALVIEGAELGIWSFHDQAAGAQLISQYRFEQFDGEVPAGATRVQRPITVGAAQITQTRPVERPRPAEPTSRQIEREPQAPAPPPAASNGETLG